jgi:hypothetical protein
LPASSSQRRFIQFTCSGKRYTAPYTITNIADTLFKWTVQPPPLMAIDTSGAIPISIAVGPVAASAIHVLHSTVTEKNRKIPLGEPLVLCESADGDCRADKKDPRINARQAREVWLHGPFLPGQYEGTLLIVTPEKPEGDTITISVFCSSAWAKFWGVGAIFGGVVLGWFATVFARNLLNRDQLLLPAVDVRERLTAAQATIEAALAGDSTRPTAPSVQRKIDELKRGLSDGMLEENGLPTRLPAPWAASPTLASVDGYRKYVQDSASWVAAIEFVVNAGLCFAWDKWDNAVAATKPPVQSALTDMAALLDPAVAPTVDALNPQLVRLRTQLLESLSAGVGAAAGAGNVGSTPTAAELRVQITRVGELAWAFIALATTLVGAFILIFQGSAAGFGSPADYVTCLLWGFGFSTGSQLLNLTPSSVATTFGVTR